MKTRNIRQKNDSSPAMRPDPADVESIDAIITAAYDGISGPAGKKRDWARERSLRKAGVKSKRLTFDLRRCVKLHHAASQNGARAVRTFVVDLQCREAIRSAPPHGIHQ
jgi:hypothetical protein